MNIKYNKEGKLEFELHDLLSCAKDETRIELIESLSCDEAVLKHVVDQILDGWTESMFSGASSFDHDSTTRYGLDIARREISKRSSEVAAKTIEDLEKTIARLEKESQELREKEWQRIDSQRRIY